MLTLDSGWKVRKIERAKDGFWYALAARWSCPRKISYEYTVLRFTETDVDGPFPFCTLEAAFWDFRKKVA